MLNQCHLFSILLFLFLFSICITIANKKHHRRNKNESSTSNNVDPGIFLFEWKAKENTIEIAISMFIFISLIFKIIYHRLRIFSHYIPESCLLIIIGIIFGAIGKKCFHDFAKEIVFTPKLFFIVLLPPIVLHSSYGLHNSAFYTNFETILLFAIIGTVLSFILFSSSIIACNYFGLFKPFELNILIILLFSSLIVAVDPVAVLAIFDEIGVNETLYFLVFGESLFNDAVTVVLYDLIHASMSLTRFEVMDCINIILAFFIVSLGGIFIGLLIASLATILTRFTRGMEFIEPMVLLTSAYISYVLATVLSWSGIIAVITCGLIHVIYAFKNIAWETRQRMNTINRMLSTCCETVIFFFLGISFSFHEHIWNANFLLLSLLFCLLSRFLVFCFLCNMINSYTSITKITKGEQFIIIYGGLRGAVAFSLVSLIRTDETSAEIRRLLITTTLFIIIVTNCIMGSTVRSFVKLFHIPLKEHTKEITGRLFLQVHSTMLLQTLCAIECIAGHKGKSRIYDWFNRMDDSYIRPILLRNYHSHQQQIYELYKEIRLNLQQSIMDEQDTLPYFKQYSHSQKKKTTINSVGEACSTFSDKYRSQKSHLPIRKYCSIEESNAKESFINTTFFKSQDAFCMKRVLSSNFEYNAKINDNLKMYKSIANVNEEFGGKKMHRSASRSSLYKNPSPKSSPKLYLS